MTRSQAVRLFALALFVAGGATPVSANSFGDGVAAYSLGKYQEAQSIWQRLADAGHRDAQYRLGLLFELGRGTPADAKQAAIWYRRAAEQSHGPAAHALGNLYAQGIGVAQDARAAFNWYLNAAEAGEARSQFHLGTLYLDGQVVEQSAAMAFFWFQKAAASEGDAHLKSQAEQARESTRAALSEADLRRVEEALHIDSGPTGS